MCQHHCNMSRALSHVIQHHAHAMYLYNQHCSQVTQVKTPTFLLLGFPQRRVQARHKHLVSMITKHRLEGQQAVCRKASLVTKTHRNSGRADAQLTPVQHQILSNILIFTTLKVSQSHQNRYECCKAQRRLSPCSFIHPAYTPSNIKNSAKSRQTSVNRNKSTFCGLRL